MPIDEVLRYPISGTIAFTIDGTPVPGCEAVPYVDGGYRCAEVSMDLSVGTHTVAATYTPTGWYADYYYPASASSEFTVQPSYYTIQGTLFNDTNQNGVWDYSQNMRMIDSLDGQPGPGLRRDGGSNCLDLLLWLLCLLNVSTSGECYRITADAKPGWQQTSHLEDFRLTEHLYSMNFGYYYPTITLNPSELPSGNVGVAYSQSFTASGGAEPYTFTISGGTLPDGLTLSAEGILSGTPTVAGSFFFYVQAEDANQAVGYGLLHHISSRRTAYSHLLLFQPFRSG